MGKHDTPRVAVLGAGPVGLEAALYARTLDLAVTVYERARVGEHLQRWGHVRLFSPFGMNSTSLGRSAIRTDSPKHDFPADTDYITGKEHLATYLEPLSKTSPLRDCLRLGTQVLHVGRRGFLKEELPGDGRRAQQPFCLLVREGNQRERVEEADVLLDCTGTYGRHRWLGAGGIPAIGETAAQAQIAYGLEDVLGEQRGAYAGKTILVVGAGYSAATTVCNLATLADDQVDTWVIWLARGSGSQPIRRVAGDPLRERDRLAVRANTLATRGGGNLEFHPHTTVEAVESQGHDRPLRATARNGAREQVWEVDRVVANIGYSPDTDLYRELQVHECYASLGPMGIAAALMKHPAADCLQITSPGPASLRNPEPNFFVLGAKSFGRNSNFLLRTGFEQVRDVFTLITGKPALDLYRKR